MTNRAIHTSRRAGKPQPEEETPNLRPAPLVLAVHLALVGGAMAAACWSTAAHAQSADTPKASADATKHYDIPAGPLGSVMSKFASISGVLLAGSSELVQGRNSPGLSGTYTTEGAIEALLSGTGLDAVRQSNGAYTLVEAPTAAAAGNPSSESTLPVVKVTAKSVRNGTTEGTGSFTAHSMSSATHLPLTMRETPQSVTVLTSARIEADNLVDLVDVAKATPGLSLSSSEVRPVLQSRGYTVESVT
ncbi:STN domain-containing protein [Pseudothauera rhizosphaerae]|uniref:TonB-dependent receptor n=1 Tax=Pseudothauera rhizosphaerae TaxID=2565932 RepID=A0A4S4AKX5_9RHOO|nr:STN domain-containing protein [Pseudothauera rhizosphaerae]THF60145.1 TonB-dependent receptor [Pseudothauera rhizosphaerae]